jgi:hypothetical protein
MVRGESSSAGEGGRVPLLILLAILALGTWARLVDAGSAASLWFDEVWRIQNLLDADSLLRQIVSPPNHIDPPAFNLAIYFLAQVHNTELVLRLVSIVPGVLSVLLAWLVGRQLFHGRWLPLLGAFLIAFAPWTTIFAKELKPYSLGLLVHLAVVYGFLRYRRNPTAKATALLVLMMILALFFSTNIVFAYPGICILMLAMGLEAGKKRRIMAAIGGDTALLAAAIIYYALFLHGADGPQSSSHLLSFWHDHFCHEESVSSATGWFFSRYLALYEKAAFTDHALLAGAGAVLRIVYPLMALAGAALILLRNRQRFLLIICLFLMPVLVMIPFNLFEIWPFGPLRMNLFLMACVVFPPLLLLDQLQGKGRMADRFLPAGLAAALLMALQFPVHFSDYSRIRVCVRKSAEALVNVIDNKPAGQRIPLLVNRSGMPSFVYYSRHHHTVSKRFQESRKSFKPQTLANHNSRLYTTGYVLRQCQRSRWVALYLSHYSIPDRALFRNDFSIEQYAFDGQMVHSSILESEIAGYEEDRLTLFTEKRFTGKSTKWETVYTSPPLPIYDAVPGTLVVVNFDLEFKSRGKMIRFRFLGENDAGKLRALSTMKNRSKRIPARIESAVHARIKEPLRNIRLVISAAGRYDFQMENVNWFATRAAGPKPVPAAARGGTVPDQGVPVSGAPRAER